MVEFRSWIKEPLNLNSSKNHSNKSLFSFRNGSSIAEKSISILVPSATTKFNGSSIHDLGHSRKELKTTLSKEGRTNHLIQGKEFTFSKEGTKTNHHQIQ
jgi:hypothetical protein